MTEFNNLPKVTQLASSLGSLAPWSCSSVLRQAASQIKTKIKILGLPLETCSVGLRWCPDICTLNKVPNDLVESSVGNRCCKEWPNKTQWRVTARRILLWCHTWEETPGKARENWVLVKTKGKEKHKLLVVYTRSRTDRAVITTSAAPYSGPQLARLSLHGISCNDTYLLPSPYHT